MKNLNKISQEQDFENLQGNETQFSKENSPFFEKA